MTQPTRRLLLAAPALLLIVPLLLAVRGKKW